MFGNVLIKGPLTNVVAEPLDTLAAVEPVTVKRFDPVAVRIPFVNVKASALKAAFNITPFVGLLMVKVPVMAEGNSAPVVIADTATPFP